MRSHELPTCHQPSTSDSEAIEWLLRFTDIACNSAEPAAERREIQDEFNQWAIHSAANRRSFLKVALLFEAPGTGQSS